MLAYNLQKLMLNAGLSSKKLADIVNVNRSTIIKILNGSTPTPRVETVFSLANYFNISVTELLGEEEHKLQDLKNTVLPNKIKENILYLMHSNKIKGVTELSHLSKIPYSVIEDIMLGNTTSPQIRTLQKLSDFFSIRITQLLGLEDLSGVLTTQAEAVRIPVYDITSLKSYRSDNKSCIPINHIEAFRKNKNNSFAIFISTDKLLPDFSKGDLLIIDTEEEPRTNDFIIAAVEKITEIFECIQIGVGFMFLKKAGSFDATKIMRENVEVIGVVIQKMVN